MDNFFLCRALKIETFSVTSAPLHGHCLKHALKIEMVGACYIVYIMVVHK